MKTDGLAKDMITWGGLAWCQFFERDKNQLRNWASPVSRDQPRQAS